MGFDYRVLLQTPLGVLSNIQDMHLIPILYLTEFQNTSGSKPFGYRIRDLFNRKKERKKKTRLLAQTNGSVFETPLQLHSK